MTGSARRVLATTGLLQAARRVRRRVWLATDRALHRREAQYRQDFIAFRRRCEGVLGPVRRPTGPGRVKTALVSGSRFPTIETELALITALQLAGYRPVVLLEDQWRVLRPYYELAGVDEIHLWSEFDTASAGRTRAAAAAIARCQSFDEAVGVTHAGIRVGQVAVSTAFRQRRVGSLDWRVEGDRQSLERCLDASLSVAAQVGRMLDVIRPELALFWDTEYSPAAELFDGCLTRGVEAISYRTAHQTNGLMFKRYSMANRDDQVSSLSARSWAVVRALEWTGARRDQVDREIASSYARGDWFKECWTQSRARLVAADDVRAALGLDPAKPTAVVFSHILWDAPLSWATPLFATYEDWLVDTVRAACDNDRVNWVIKIHPANVGKKARDGYAGDPAEVRALRTRLGPLPPHVAVLPPETDLSATSVFQVMDYCVTVRGTVGIEAARLGVPVLTAAAARYSGKGFTVDSATREEYLTRIARIEDTPPLTAGQRELAERFAYGMFILRPLVMKSVTWDYGELGAPTRAEFTLKTAEEWRKAPDLGALARWFGESRDEDFLASAG